MVMFICKICMESFPLNQCFKTATFRTCFNSFCGCCTAKYIQAETSNNTAYIQCPYKEACHNHILDPLKCKGLISKASLDKWCDLLCELAIRGLERCYCPNMGCLELIVDECSGVNDNVHNKKITCPSCKISCCFGCSSPWQDGHRCSRGRYNYLPRGNNCQRCPGCRYYVERNGGCRIIHCRCGTAFCYYCGSRSSYLGRCQCTAMSGTGPELLMVLLTLLVYLIILVFSVFERT